MSILSYLANQTTNKNYPSISGTVREIVPGEADSSGFIQEFFIKIEELSGSRFDRSRVVWVWMDANQFGSSIAKLGLNDEDKASVLVGEAITPTKLPNVTIFYDSLTSETVPNLSTVAYSFISCATLPLPKSETQKKADSINSKSNHGAWLGAEDPLVFTPIGVPGFNPLTDTRIGYAVLGVPVGFVEQSRTSYIEQIPGLRQTGALKKSTGKAYETYTISYIVKDEDEIKSAVQEVIEQMTLTPFLPVQGGPFGKDPSTGDIPYSAIAVRGVSISTIPGQPNSLKVDINFDPFNWEYFCGIDAGDGSITGGDKARTFPRYSFDSMFCYPLFKLWCKTRQKSKYDDSRFSGLFSLSFPAPDLYKNIAGVLKTGAITDTSKNSSALKGLRSLIDTPNSVAQTPDAKNIISTTTDFANTSYYVIKVYDKQTWQKFVPYTLGDAPAVSGGESMGKYFAGLVWWNKISAFNAADEQGNLLPNSNYVNPTLVTESLNPGESIKGNTRNPTDITDLGIPGLSLNDQLDAWAPDTGPFGVTSEELKAMIRKTPWDFFGIVITVDSSHKSTVINKLSALIRDVDKTTSVSYQSLNSKLADVFTTDSNPTTPFLVIKDPSHPDNTEDIIIEGISGTRGHNLSMYSGFFDPLPCHQHMGGTGAIFTVQGKCIGQKAKRLLESVKREFDHRALNTPSPRLVGLDKAMGESRVGPAFLRVRNELFQLLGVDFVIPESLSIQSVDGQPDVWEFSLGLVEHDISLMNTERVQFLPTYLQNLGKAYYQGIGSSLLGGHTNPIIDRAREHFSLLYSLSQIETYPDMALPTITELEYWIQICQRAAEKRIEKKATKESTKPNFTKDEEDTLLRHIDPYLRYYAKQISNWRVGGNRKATLTPVIQGGFVDPDFYCFYDHRSSWRNTFDVITEDCLGVVGENLKSTGSRSEIPPVWRQYDPEYDTTTVAGPEYFSLSEDHIKEASGGTEPYNTSGHEYFKKNSYPIENAKKASDAVLAKDKQYDNTAPVKVKWWLSAGAVDENNDVQLPRNRDAELAKTTLTGVPPLFDFMKSGEEPGPYTKLFYDVAAKQRLVKDLLSAGKNQHLPTNVLKRASWGFITSTSNISNTFLFDSNAKNLLGLTLQAENIPLIYQTYKDIAEAVVKTQISGNLNAPVVPQVFKNSPKEKESTIANISGGLSYLTRTIISTEGYSKAQSNTVRELQSVATTQKPNGDAESNLEETARLTNAISASLNIDPNVLRTILHKRSGSGSNPEFSGRTGVGDFDSGALSSVELGSELGVLESGYAIGVAKIATTYKKYLNQGLLPSAALIALEYELSGVTDTKNAFRGLSPKRLEELRTLSAQISNIQGEGDSAAKMKALQQLVSTQGLEGGALVNSYYEGYIEICRAYGSIVAGQATDMFFNPLNPLILIDQGDTSGRVLTTFTPNGNPVQYSTDRARLSQRSAVFNGSGTDFNPTKEDIIAAARKERKLKNALDPTSETSMYGFMHDLRHHSVHGRLLGAFPSYQILLINEGWYYLAGNVKLWDQYYTRTGVSGIEVFKSRKHSAAECNITFSNMYHKLAAYQLQHVLEQQVTEYTQKKIGRAVTGLLDGGSLGLLGNTAYNVWLKKEPDKELLKIWQNNQLKQIALNVGTRVQVRMGYGSNSATLPVVFNGTVATAPVDEGYVTLLCVGDGIELNNQSTTKLVPAGNSFAFEDGGAFGIGKDPSSIISEALIAGGTFDSILQGNFRDWSSGIAHFGDVYYEEMKSWPAELQINIYSSNPTKLEQGLGTFQNYFNVNALYNFNQSHLFSIEVHEPTPWKVAETCRRACLDFVASAEQFCTRSTLFFGKWWWPYNYTWDPSIMTLDLPETKKQPNSVAPSIPVSAESAITQPAFSGESIAYPGGYKGPKTSSASTLSTKRKTDPILVGYSFASEHDKELILALIYRSVVEIGYNASEIMKIQRVGFSDLVTFSDGKSVTVDRSPDPTNQRTPAAKVSKPSTGGFSINNEKTEITPDRTSPADLIKDVNDLVNYLQWKPYMQAYFAHSMLNLLDNNIETTKEGVFTDAMGQHSFNGFLSGDSIVHTITYSLDSDIVAADRSTAMVDTSLAVTGMQEGIGKALASAGAQVLSIIPFVDLSTFIRETPSTPAIENSVVSHLVDSAKDMYKGSITMMGTPTMKPRDLVYLTDHINDLRGPIFAKEVFHRMDTQTGFITMVTPDCVVVPQSSEVGQRVVTALSNGPLHRLGAFMIFKAAAAATFGGAAGLIKSKQGGRDADTLRKYFTIVGTSEENLFTTGGRDLINKAIPHIEQDFAKQETELSEKIAKETDTAKGGTRDVLFQKLDDLRKKKQEVLSSLRTVSGKDKLLTLDVAVNRLREIGYGSLLSGDRGLLGELPGGETRAQIISFEHEMLKEEEILREQVKNGSRLLGATAAEQEVAIERELQQRRVHFFESLGDRGTDLFEEVRVSSLANPSEIRNELQGLIDEYTRLKAAGKDLTKITEKIDNRFARLASSNFGKTFDELEPEIQKIFTSPAIQEVLNRSGSIKTPGRAQGWLKWVQSWVYDAPFGSVASATKSTAAALTGGTVAPGTKSFFGKTTKFIGENWNKPSNVAKLVEAKLKAAAEFVGLADTAELTALKAKEGVTAEEIKAAEEIAATLRKRKQAVAAWRLQKAAKAGYTTTRDIVTAGRILSYGTPLGVVRLAVDVGMFTIGGQLLEGYNARARARQCVKIIPLAAGDHPYLGGLRGHAGAVVGDDPSWADKLIGDFGSFMSGGPGLIFSFISPIDFSQIEIPKYGRTEIDQVWYKVYQNKLDEIEAHVKQWETQGPNSV